MTDPKSTSALAIAKTIPKRMNRHNDQLACAGIAFFGTLALVPTLIAMVSIYGLVASEEDVADTITDLSENLDESTAKFLETQLNEIVGGNEGAAITSVVVGILLALFTASGAVQKLIQTINVAYETTDARSGLKNRFVAFCFTLGAMVSVAVVGTVIGAVPVIADQIGLGDAAQAAINIGRFPLMGLFVVFAMTLLYRFGPSKRPRTAWRNVGSVVATVLFLLIAVAMSLFLSNFDLPPAYGLLGSVAVLMLFIQFTALAMTIGAEVNAELEERKGLVPHALATTVESGPVEPMSLGKALAAVAALFVLGRD